MYGVKPKRVICKEADPNQVLCMKTSKNSTYMCVGYRRSFISAQGRLPTVGEVAAARSDHRHLVQQPLLEWMSSTLKIQAVSQCCGNSSNISTKGRLLEPRGYGKTVGPHRYCRRMVLCPWTRGLAAPGTNKCNHAYLCESESRPSS